MTSYYDHGDLIRSSAVFATTAGTATDPGTVVFKLRSPDGTVTTYTAGVDAALVNDATGTYHVDFAPALTGQWWLRWEGTGTIQQAEETFIFLNPSQF